MSETLSSRKLDPRAMVAAFHKLNGAVIDGHNNGPEVALLRLRLIAEECAETIVAVHKGDVIEVADGLCDLLYVVIGTAVSYALPINLVFHNYGMVPVEVFSTDQFDALAKCANLLFWTAKCAEALDAGNLRIPPTERALVKLGAQLGALADAACVAGALWGFPMAELFTEVHRSNMTKTFAPDKNMPGGKYGAVNPKGPSYSPPDIAGILDRAWKHHSTTARVHDGGATVSATESVAGPVDVDKPVTVQGAWQKLQKELES